MNWATTDSISALDYLTSANLDDDDRHSLQQGVIRKWVSQDPEAIIGRISELPEELRDFGHLEAWSQFASNSPESAALQIGSIQDSETLKVTAIKIARNWLRRDVSGAVNWVQTSGGIGEIRQEVLTKSLQDLAENDPILAIDIAVQHLVDNDEVGLEAVVIERVSRENVDEALNLLPEVRSEATKKAAYTSVGTALASEGDLDRAMELADELPEASRTLYTGMVVSMWSLSHPTEVVERVDQLPTEELKSQAALMALTSNRQQEKLTEDQVTELRTYVSEELLEMFDELKNMMTVPP